MEKKIIRDPLYDTFRGLLIWCIPISHFTMEAGHFVQDSFGGVVYLTINVFVIQAFMFLAGYFSKNVDKSRNAAFKSLLWPYILSIFFFYEVRMILWGNANLYFKQPPFAMWFLLALFLYKFFIKSLIKVPYILWISFFIYLIAGCLPFLTEFMSLARIVSYLPFFILGYYVNSSHIEKIKKSNKWKMSMLGIVLIYVSVLLAYKLPQITHGWYLLRNPGASNGVNWTLDITMRLLLVLLGVLWIIVSLNLLPKKENYLSYVGRNTMPIYIFHLVIRQWLKGNDGLSFGIVGVPDPNSVIYYISIFVLASLSVVVFSSKPFVKLYDIVVDGSYEILIAKPIKLTEKIKKRYIK
ncbi:MAG: acyltransferase family protein [Peptostreptococcaceae bacterium]|nr:acyltransferase family protein [Peptostreptococcaceae bacterium]